jgi:hypothetical protein
VEHIDAIFTSLTKLHENVAMLNTAITVLASKQEESLKKTEENALRMEQYSERLRTAENYLSQHKGFFILLGTGVVVCIGAISTGLLNLLIN